jgi:sec-independent protein translocase protein TatA
MFGLGAPELIIIALVILALFGYKKLPDAARSIGRSMRIFKAETKAMSDDPAPRDLEAKAEAQYVREQPQAYPPPATTPSPPPTPPAAAQAPPPAPPAAPPAASPAPPPGAPPQASQPAPDPTAAQPYEPR